MTQKLYCYVDETGQDTKGDLFIVSLVVTGKEREEIIAALEKIELKTTRAKKWRNNKKEVKVNYIKNIIAGNKFRNKIYFTLKKDTKAYKELTMIAVASVINEVKKTDEYKASIFIDGLPKSELLNVGTGLRKIGIKIEKVRGVKDESSAIIRLADAVAGLVRENVEDIAYAKKLFEQGMKRKIWQEI